MRMDLNEMPIEKLGLSVRSTNALHRSHVHVAGDMLNLTEDRLYAIRNLGEKSVNEILRMIDDLKAGRFTLGSAGLQGSETFLLREAGTNSGNPIDAGEPAVDGRFPLTIFDMVREPAYHDLILANARKYDQSLEDCLFSTRAINRLRGKGYRKISDIIFLAHDDLIEIRSLGAKSIQEIEDAVRMYLVENESQLLTESSGTDESSRGEPESGAERVDGTSSGCEAIDYARLPKKILALYRENGFRGYSLKEMEEALQLPETVDEKRLKHIIGTLLASGELEYVDFRCYRVYRSFAQELERCDQIDDRSREIIQKRLEGVTLEGISKEFGLTRERVRQIINRDARVVAAFHRKTTGTALFDEDYYRYFYETYAVEKKDAIEWLGIPESVFRYFDMMDVREGSRNLNRALEDHTGLDAGLRLKIKNYINRDRTFICGVWVKRRRDDLERTAVRKLCREQISFREFVSQYNSLLLEQEIDDQDLLITDAVYRTRLNKLTDSRNTLWSRGGKLRYYDIDGQDYEELFSELNLSSFENVELSTWKLFHEHPDLMKKYDIRDHYELHSLLRKTVRNGEFHQFQCMTMPYIRFGEFDRNAALRKLIEDNSPIRTADLCSLLEEIYGYDPTVVQSNYLPAFSGLCNQGVYTVSRKTMTAENRKKLQSALDNDFYSVDQIKEIYAAVSPGADGGEINASLLREMGFSMTAGYAWKNYPTLETYFRSILAGGIPDLQHVRYRFRFVGAFYQVFQDLRKNLDLVEFEENRFVSTDSLKAFGITKNTLRGYCDRVWNNVTDGEYFSIVSLRKRGFESGLDDLVFSDKFYTAVLLSDERFSSAGMWGMTIFRKGEERLTSRMFLEYLTEEDGCYDMSDLTELLNENYGCQVQLGTDILSKITESDLYYDDSSDRLYRNVELYYQEFDEKEGERS